MGEGAIGGPPHLAVVVLERRAQRRQDELQHVMPRFRHEPLAGQGIRALLKSEANAW